MKTYDPKIIESKWSKAWDKTKAFNVDIKTARKPFYNLAMFPYPSGEGLHMGHIIPYSGCDTYGRYLRMNQYDVFEPMGFDAFGIHSENFSLKKGIHPKTLISQTTRYFREKQMKRLGTLFDWDREVNTTDPDYYQWTQWLFIQMFKHGLAEKRKAPVTYCPSCKTVLSDEQTEIIKTSPHPSPARRGSTEGEVSVIVCERCKTPIERKELEQWFFKITKYADRLLSNLNHLSPDAFGKNKKVSKYDQEHGINWSEKTKNSQKNWIGKSEGINITYQVVSSSETITCFTTRPDTNFGATFIVLAPEHPFVKFILSQKTSPLVSPLLPGEGKGEVSLEEISSYIKKATSKSEMERISEAREKTGVFTGFYAINNLNSKKMPIWISDFVIMSVGTGAVVGVPGHDKRDYDFAKKFDLEIKTVVVPDKNRPHPGLLPEGEGSLLPSPFRRGEGEVFEGEGFCVNSGFLNGLPTPEAKAKIMDHLEEKGWGKRVAHFKLRDWCISRQRYWGPPIPMIYCEKCGWQPVPEKDLPVLLPFIKDYKPTGEGKSPLAKDAKFLKVKCPHCGGWAERETDVSDTFLDSAWYFLRYPSVGLNSKSEIRNTKQILNHNSQNSKQKSFDFSASNFELPWDPEVTRHWLPVDMYIGGHEHAVLHLMYSRFVTMALKDMGFIDFEEPFIRFFAHGLMTSGGAKMSKSRGNVVNPNQYLDKYGADTLRMYILFMGPYDAGSDFKMAGIAGMHKFLKRVWVLVNENFSPKSLKSPRSLNEKDQLKLKIAQNKTIKKVGEDIANLHFNTAIAAIMEYYNILSDAASKTSPLPSPNRRGDTRGEVQWYDALKTLLLLLAPFAPFITEELYQALINADNNADKRKVGVNPRHYPHGSAINSIHSHPWPKFDPKFLEEEEVTIIVQVNGKVRDKIKIKNQKSKIKSEVEKLAWASTKVQSYLSSTHPPPGGPKNTIFVPGKLVNFVV